MLLCALFTLRLCSLAHSRVLCSHCVCAAQLIPVCCVHAASVQPVSFPCALFTVHTVFVQPGLIPVCCVLLKGPPPPSLSPLDMSIPL